MKRFKTLVLRFSIIVIVLYGILILLLYVYQEKLIFHPKTLSKEYKFQFPGSFEELQIKETDGKNISALLFKADSAKGLVFYLHGNSGALDTWGDLAKTYTALKYDFFIVDYRSFGKSEGEIESEEQFFADIQTAYDLMKTKYPENKIVIIGYSIGTGPAAMLASRNNPKQLILKAPYYSLTDMMHYKFSFAPDFILNYKFETFKFIQNTKAPITIFHGTSDGVINYASSLKLKEHFKQKDKLVTLEGQKHNGINENPVYLIELEELLK